MNRNLAESRPRENPMLPVSRVVFTCTMLGLWMIQPSLAATTFKASTLACSASQSVIQVGAPAVASSGPSTCDVAGSTSQAASSASSEGLQGTGSLHYFCCGASMGASTSARVESEFIIDGPVGTALVGLAMDLESAFTTSSSGGVGDIQIRVGIGNSTAIGHVGSGGFTLFGGMSAFPLTTNGPVHIVVTPVPVPVGVPVLLFVELVTNCAGVDRDALASTDVNRLTLARTTDVFLLPSGYTVRDIPDLRVTNNRFVSTLAVPPSTDVASAAPRLEVSPNPCRGPLRIRWTGPSASRVRDVAVYAVDGRRVRTLRLDAAGDGTWDHRDELGVPVAPGIYLVRDASGSKSGPGPRVVVLR